MKKASLILPLIMLMITSFVIAETYQGDGTYVLNKGDVTILDNGYKLVLTNVEAMAQSPTNVVAVYYFDIYKGDSKLKNTSFKSFNFDTSNYSIDIPGKSIAEITFTAGMNPDLSEVKITSLGEPEEIETQGKETQESGNEYSGDVEKPGFFKRTWTWFKCLFSRKC